MQQLGLLTTTILSVSVVFTAALSLKPACPDKISHKYTKATKEFSILNTLLICVFLFTLEMTFLNTTV